MALFLGPESKILVTGGASVNRKILQVISDVFNAPVFTQDSTSNSCSFGSCLRAFHAFKGGEEKLPFEDIFEAKQSGFVLQAEPNSDAKTVYNPMVGRFKKLEQSLLS